LALAQKAGVQPKRRLEEFRVTADAVLPVGTEITCLHFVPGQYVDVRALSYVRVG
jgi:large subunit ribosomal protein L3